MLQYVFERRPSSTYCCKFYDGIFIYFATFFLIESCNFYLKIRKKIYVMLNDEVVNIFLYTCYMKFFVSYKILLKCFNFYNFLY